jgi:hypothetical protein
LGSPLQFKCYIDAIDYATTIEQGKEGGERRRRKKEGKVEEWNSGSEYFSNIDGAI